MLVLTRKLRQTVMVGAEVAVTVIGIEGDKVRLGFAAPTELPVHRKEVFDRIRQHGGPASVAAQKYDESAD